MQRVESLINSYFTFHYGVGFAIGLIIFCGYMFLISRRKKSQGQSVSRKEILCGLALSIYIVFLLGGTILNREIGDEYLIEWMPFWSYLDLLSKWSVPMLVQMLYNVLVFIPWGFLLPEMVCIKRKIRMVLLSAFGLSFGIEIIQLVFKLGLFEFDDVFHNVLGAVIGYGLWRVWTYFQFLKYSSCSISSNSLSYSEEQRIQQ